MLRRKRAKVTFGGSLPTSSFYKVYRLLFRFHRYFGLTTLHGSINDPWQAFRSEVGVKAAVYIFLVWCANLCVHCLEWRLLAEYSKDLSNEAFISLLCMSGLLLTFVNVVANGLTSLLNSKQCSTCLKEFVELEESLPLQERSKASLKTCAYLCLLLRFVFMLFYFLLVFLRTTDYRSTAPMVELGLLVVLGPIPCMFYLVPLEYALFFCFSLHLFFNTIHTSLQRALRGPCLSYCAVADRVRRLHGHYVRTVRLTSEVEAFLSPALAVTFLCGFVICCVSLFVTTWDRFQTRLSFDSVMYACYSFSVLTIITVSAARVNREVSFTTKGWVDCCCCFSCHPLRATVIFKAHSKVN